MQIKDNQQHTREYSIYLNHEKERIPVTKDVYDAYYRPIWRLFRKAHDHGQCTCSGNCWWKCQGDCASCKYVAAGDTWSLEYEKEIMGDIHSDPNYDVEDITIDRMHLEELFKALEQLDPYSRRICEFIRQGKSERESAAELGIPRSTYEYQKGKVMDMLKKSLKELF